MIYLINKLNMDYYTITNLIFNNCYYHFLMVSKYFTEKSIKKINIIINYIYNLSYNIHDYDIIYMLKNTGIVDKKLDLLEYLGYVDPKYFLNIIKNNKKMKMCNSIFNDIPDKDILQNINNVYTKYEKNKIFNIVIFSSIIYYIFEKENFINFDIDVNEMREHLLNENKDENIIDAIQNTPDIKFKYMAFSQYSTNIPLKFILCVKDNISLLDLLFIFSKSEYDANKIISIIKFLSKIYYCEENNILTIFILLKLENKYHSTNKKININDVNNLYIVKYYNEMEISNYYNLENDILFFVYNIGIFKQTIWIFETNQIYDFIIDEKIFNCIDF